MLQTNSIGSLSFQRCWFQLDGVNVIVDGLRVNQSLQELDFKMIYGTDSTMNLLQGIPELLSINNEITDLALDMTNQDCWDIYRAVESHPTLTSLKLYEANMTLSSVSAIMKICQDTPSLESLAFDKCRFAHTGLQFLTEQLSKHIALNLLGFYSCSCEETPAATLSSQLNWTGLNVKSFALMSTTFGDASVAAVIEGMASNETVQYMDLSDAFDNEDDVRILCDTRFLENRGPPHMILEPVGGQVPLIVEALRDNTRLQSLEVACIDVDDLMAFALGLAHIRGPRSLHIGCDRFGNHYTPAFFQALQDGLELNTRITTLTIWGIDECDTRIKPFVARIRYLVAINRIGRHTLLTSNRVPPGLWARVLARCSTDPDGIHFVLPGKPELVHSASRKHRRSRPIAVRKQARREK